MTTRGTSIVDHIFCSSSVGTEASVQDPFVHIAGHRPIIGKLDLTAQATPAFPTYSRIKLENLRNPDTKARFQIRLTNSIRHFKTRISNFINSTAFTSIENHPKQGIVDDFDRNLVKCILSPAREILGVKTCGKKNLKYEPLQSEELEILEVAMALETNFERNAILFEKASKEMERLRKERFDVFSEEVSSKSASDIMKITSAMLSNRKKH